MVFGLLAALVAGTLAMAQVERSANRLAGQSEDRPVWQRYGVAFVLAVSAGVLLAAGGLALNEVNPMTDHRAQTSILAANLVFQFAVAAVSRP